MASEEKAHESLVRLREVLRLATNRADLDYGDITKMFEIDSSVMTNWKRRGVPAKVAIDVEVLHGYPASYILLGKRPKEPPHKPDMASRPAPSASDWALLDAIAAMPPEMKELKTREILQEGAKWRAFEEAVLAKYRRPGKP